MTHILLTTFIESILDADTKLFLSINSMHNSFWDVFMPLYSSKFVWCFFYFSILYLIARNYSLKVTLTWLLAVVLVITICDQVTASLIRPMVARLRPSNLENPISNTVHIVNGYRGGSYSFPSAHAANSWGLALFVVLLFRKRWLSLTVILWAVVTCYSRMYLGVHYFGDLFIGMIIGCLGATFVYYMLMWIAKLDKPKEIKHSFVPVIALLITVFVFLAISTYETFFS